MSATTLIIMVLAVWRLSSLFANEEGPLDLFVHIRRVAARYPKFYKGLECEWCNSVWFGTIVTILYYFIGDEILWLLLPLALSTPAIIIKFIVQNLETWQENNLYG